jgi:hypothetical protein
MSASGRQSWEAKFMLSAIGSSTSSSYATTGIVTSPAGLESQLAKHQKELADCVNCASAGTLESKTKIQGISGKISEIQSHLQKLVVAASSSQSSSFNANHSSNVNTDQNTIAQQTNPNKAVLTAGSTNPFVGTQVNVYA